MRQQINIRVPMQWLNRIKLRAKNEGKTLTQYIVDLFNHRNKVDCPFKPIDIENDEQQSIDQNSPS